MECFHHPGQVSVALCKVCHKAICHGCCQFSSKSYVCSDACAEQERLQDQVTTWSMKYIGSGRRSSLITRQYAYISLTFIIMGVAMIGPVAYDYFVNQSPVYYPLLLLGIAMLFCAFLAYRSKPQ